LMNAWAALVRADVGKSMNRWVGLHATGVW
jgi:hypothetical protein